MRRIVAVQPVGGLCNRLRVISSFEELAARTDRQFAVHWAPSEGWSHEELADLFENEVPLIDGREFAEIRAAALALDEVAGRAAREGIGRRRRPRSGASAMSMLDADRHPAVTYRGTARCDQLLPLAQRDNALPGFTDAYAELVRRWRPTRDIRIAVEAIARDFDERTVGVHVRRGDAWLSTGVGPAYMRSSDAAFVARLDAIGAGSSGATFFLATDDAETERRFRRRYGDAVIVNSEKRFVESLPGRSKDNQRDAVIDLFALARTSRVIGTNYSSFSEMAATLGDIRLERAFNSRWRGALSRVPGVARARVRLRRTRAGIW